MALVLYSDDMIVHCLNMHYLSQNLYLQLINVVAQIAAKRIENKSAYELYHRQLKKMIPSILKASYRTYKPQHIQSINIVSNGFNETIGWLSQNKDKAIKKYEKVIDKQINKAEPKSPEELEKIAKATPQQIIQNIEKYFNIIKNIRKTRVDKTRYTALSRRKK